MFVTFSALQKNLFCLFQDPFGEDDWDPSVKFTADIDAEVRSTG